ncbi:hypothetical protein ACWGQ5_44685 [Streptomyces sp. NPDC055722]
MQLVLQIGGGTVLGGRLVLLGVVSARHHDGLLHSQSAIPHTDPGRRHTYQTQRTRIPSRRDATPPGSGLPTQTRHARGTEGPGRPPPPEN